jgi:type VI secretion system secreted protein Hcp
MGSLAPPGGSRELPPLAETPPREYLKINMKEVYITSVGTGGSGDQDRLTENVSLDFGSVKVEYQEQQKDRSGKKAPEMSWSVAPNASE